MKNNKLSYLFITLDSCRYDTFVKADSPNMKSVGRLYKTFSNGNYTYASHAAMFVGFTPGNPYINEPYVNPKIGKIFRVAGSSYVFAKDCDHIVLEGRNIIDGFNNIGYTTIGVAAMDWFNPSQKTSQQLISDFDHFKFTGIDVKRQVDFVLDVAEKRGGSKFIFMNIGETHVPYYFEGAPWDALYNPCLPFGENNSRKECSKRQKACLEFIDKEIEPLLTYFKNDNIIICADHGDCWGEDNLWEHGIHHEMTVTVPLVYSLK